MAFVRLPLFLNAVAHSVMLPITFAVCLGVSAGMRATAAGDMDTARPTSLINFDIPSQPLASALEAYGASTGIEVFYDAALAAGHRSTAVKGMFTAVRGLEALLRGTGYAPRETGLGTISVAPVSQEKTKEAAALGRAFHRYDWYFAILQRRLSKILCDGDRAVVGNGEIIFKFRLANSGAVTYAGVIASGGDPLRDRTLAQEAQGLDIGEPPPPDLPEPIIMVVFPPSSGEAPGCHE